MSLHPDVLSDLLDAEADVAREALGPRVEQIERHGLCVHCVLTGGAIVAFDGNGYDTAPFAVSVVDSNHDPVPGAAWPPRMNHGNHPIFSRPFLCIQGTLEYHTHPSHVTDQWDTHRGRIQLVNLIDHILTKIAS